MALALVGLIVVLISRFLAYPLGLYLGLIVVVVGFIIYAVTVLKVPTTRKYKS
jgi:hypothetical protein